MDALIAHAAQALAAGDALGALKRVALRDDAPALALRGIALAQLGDLARARPLLRAAARGFGARDLVPRARCVVAEAEVAFAQRDLGWSPGALDEARRTLAARGDRANAAHAAVLAARRLLMLGAVDEAERELAALDARALPPALAATVELVRAGVAMRRLRARAAREALARAGEAARGSGIPALVAEVGAAARTLEEPAARLVARGAARAVTLAEVEALLASGALVVDACRDLVRAPDAVVPLATRPVLLALARTLAEAWPGDAGRDTLIARAFGSSFTDASHRARLRVELARLRVALGALAEVRATARGFALVPRAGREVAVLAPLVEDGHARLLALLADGEAWASGALALATGTSQRTVQRALDALLAAGRVQALGRGRARRWIAAPLPGIATPMLLPAPLAID